MGRKILPFALALLLTVFVVPVSAGVEATYPDPDCNVAIDNPGATFGDTVTITGTCDAGDVVTATFYTDADAAGVGSAAVIVLGSVTADAAGDWSLPVVIPAGASTAAALEVVSSNFGVLLALAMPAAVVAPEPTPTATPLAFTGSNSGPMTTVAGLLLVAGGGLVLAGRRRRNAA